MVCSEFLVDIPSGDLQDIHGDAERQISERILLSDTENLYNDTELRNHIQGQRLGKSSSRTDKVGQWILRRRRIQKFRNKVVFKFRQFFKELKELLQLRKFFPQQLLKLAQLRQQFKLAQFRQQFLQLQEFFQRKIQRRILRRRRSQRKEVISSEKTEGDVIFTSPSFA